MATTCSTNRRTSHLATLELPTPALNRSTSHRSNHGSSTPFSDDFTLRPDSFSSMMPFPRQTSAEFFRNSQTPSPIPSPLSTTRDGSNSPAWPNPASYSVSTSPSLVTAATTKPVQKQQIAKTSSSSSAKTPLVMTSSQLAHRLITLEISLGRGNRLAETLEGQATLQSIKEASGVVSTEITTSGEGSGRSMKRLECMGSASAVQKARQLVDAKLSQTPIRTLVAIDVPPSTASLAFAPTVGPHVTRLQPLALSTYRLVTSRLPPTTTLIVSPPPLTRRPLLESFPSTTSVISAFSLPPSHTSSPAPSTPTSECDSFVTVKEEVQTSPSSSPPCRSPGTAPLSFSFIESAAVDTTAKVETKEDQIKDTTNPPPPKVGSWNGGERRDQYIEALLNELEFAVKRRSLVRVKMEVGGQEWRRDDGEEGEGEFDLARERWSIDEIETWKTDASRKVTSRTTSPVSPIFVNSLSASTAHRTLQKLASLTSFGTFESKGSVSQVHILHLDKSRASFGNAIADVRGQDLRNLPSGVAANGTLVLKKCSTLPTKPFALSIVSPHPVDEPHHHSLGTDLMVKVSADKAATSPSLDLSAAMQSATWELDAFGVFRVNVKLKEERFGKGETEIRWTSRERWENEASSLRLTISELRYSETDRHEHSIELCSPALNRLLADYALDQAQGKKGRWERGAIKGWIEKLVEFGESLVVKEESTTSRDLDDRYDEDDDNDDDRTPETTLASGLVTSIGDA